MKAMIAAVAVCLIAGSGGAFAAPSDVKRPGSFPTNLELLEELAREVVDSTLEKVQLEPGEAVLVRCSDDHEAAWVVEDYLAGRLAALGVYVYVEVDSGKKARAPVDRLAEEGGESAAGRFAGPAGSKTGGDAEADTTGFESDEESGPDFSEFDRDDPFKSGEDLTEEPGLAEPEDAAGLDVADTSKAKAPVSEAGQVGSEVEAAEGAETAPVLFQKVPVPDKVLELRIAELEVAYTRRWRKSLFGSAMVERSARTVLSFRLMDGQDGRVLWTDTSRLEKRDVVPQKLLAQLEDTAPAGEPRSSGGGIGRIVEPIVVSGIVAGLVLLFYSSRT